MTAISFPQKLAKLIPMLSSDSDGEVVNSARAIGRALRAAGADFHDLARIVAAASQASARSTAPPHPQPRVHEPIRPAGPPRWEALTHLDRLVHLDWLLRWGHLSPWEQGFVASIEALISRRPGVRLSAKQIAQLNDLLRKEWEWVP